MQSWKRRVAGDFFILRYLKRYTYFLSSGKSAKGVWRLGAVRSAWTMCCADRPLPVLVKRSSVAVQRPHHLRWPVHVPQYHFRGGIRGDLNETYQTAKQTGKIIESLEPGAEPARKPKPQKPARDWSPVLDGVVEMTEQLKQGENVIQTRAYSIAQGQRAIGPGRRSRSQQPGRNRSARQECSSSAQPTGHCVSPRRMVRFMIGGQRLEIRAPRLPTSDLWSLATSPA